MSTTEIMARCEELRAISELPDAYLRQYLSAEHRRAADTLLGWCCNAGLDARLDAAGNVVARLEGRTPGLPALVLGSHFDTVRDAGRYDGQLGVIGAIEAVSRLQARAHELPFALEIYGFADEEGVRFGTSYLASGFVTGNILDNQLALRDARGTSLSDALRDFGLDPARIGKARRRPQDFLGYIELHIEQGPVLEQADRPLGTVTSIAAQARLRVTVTGEAGHAGTVPMDLRRDALAAAAECILAVEQTTLQYDGAVGTVGRLDAEPGAGNVVPGRCSFSIDLRAPCDRRHGELYDEVAARLGAITDRRGVRLDIECISRHGATICDPALSAVAEDACRDVAGAAPRLVSGAGHDAAAMAALCPVAMIFVRCQGGISHNPAEAVELEDAGLGVDALCRFVERLGTIHAAEPN